MFNYFLIFVFPVGPAFVSTTNDSLTDIRSNLTELEDMSRRNNVQIDGIAEEPGETLEECEMKVQRLLSEELHINDVVV